MLNIKYFTLFAFLLFVALGYKTYEQYQRISETHQIIIENESQSLANFISAFRQTYQDAFVENHIEMDEKIITLLPVKTISEISRRFSKKVKEDIVIRTVSDRPRNLQNKADEFEMSMIDYFKKNPNKTFDFHKKEDAYYYTQPLYIQQSCLRCHGTREEAIPSVRQKYTRAYDYKLGDIRGLLNIKIKDHGHFTLLYKDFKDTLMITIVIYILFLFLIYRLLQSLRSKEQEYTIALESEIEAKTGEIEKQKNIFETLFEKSSDGILIVDKEKFVQCNEKIIEIMRCEKKEEILGKEIHSFSPKFQPDGRLSKEKAFDLANNALNSDGFQFEWFSQRANGETFWSELSVTPVVLNERKVLYIIVRDISDKKVAQKKLMEQKDKLFHQAHHDALTGLPNRTLFHDRLAYGIEKSEKKGRKLALFFIDLDQFKQINDSLGHEAGDKVLVVTAERLKAKIGKKDTLARLGGDEFIVIMENYKKLENIEKLAKHILAVLLQPIHIEGQTLYTSCSIGIALYPKDDTCSENLLKFADAAMYTAKEEGRNNYQFYKKEMTADALDRIVMKSDLRKALENEEFFVAYQPQIDAQNNELIGLEALIRWNHPTMGIIYPHTFLPLAEENGLIVEIDRWVMQTAIQRVSQWYKEGYTPGVLALNLTLTNLRRDDYIGALQQSIRQNDFNAVNLELEITEGEVMKKFDEIILKLNLINEMHIRIAIDDFGTGHSSLSYLKKLPIKKLKIDKSFIDEVPQNKEDAAIIKAIIALAQNLNLEVLAEGVERKMQKDFLLENGCYNIQGYYFDPALSVEAFEVKYLAKK